MGKWLTLSRALGVIWNRAYLSCWTGEKNKICFQLVERGYDLSGTYLGKHDQLGAQKQIYPYAKTSRECILPKTDAFACGLGMRAYTFSKAYKVRKTVSSAVLRKTTCYAAGKYRVQAIPCTKECSPTIHDVGHKRVCVPVRAFVLTHKVLSESLRPFSKGTVCPGSIASCTQSVASKLRNLYEPLEEEQLSMKASERNACKEMFSN